MAASLPPDDSDTVELTFALPIPELTALQQLAERLNLSVPAVLRNAVMTEVFLRGLVHEGVEITYTRPNGETGRIDL
jgi:hypothetical protein